MKISACQTLCSDSRVSRFRRSGRNSLAAAPAPRLTRRRRAFQSRNALIFVTRNIRVPDISRNFPRFLLRVLQSACHSGLTCPQVLPPFRPPFPVSPDRLSERKHDSVRNFMRIFLTNEPSLVRRAKPAAYSDRRFPGGKKRHDDGRTRFRRRGQWHHNHGSPGPVQGVDRKNDRRMALLDFHAFWRSFCLSCSTVRRWSMICPPFRSSAGFRLWCRMKAAFHGEGRRRFYSMLLPSR